MKIILSILILVATGVMARSQSMLIRTDFFIVRGEIKNSQTFTLASIGEFSAKDLNDITTYNNLGEARAVLRNVKGVLLKDILKKIQLNLSKPNQSYAFYLECTATDGYKTVFSWNEIMNSPDGSQIYIVTGHDGKPLASLEDRIAILQLSGPGKGHVNIKGLQQITIESVK